MNDPNSPLLDDAGQRKQEGAPVSVGRRRFAKGVAPVVLGTLVSKPVLGADYACTMSGFTSGNASAHVTNVNCAAGYSPGYWALDTTSWPSEFTKGALPDSACIFPVDSAGVSTKGTPFNGYAGLDAVFYIKSVGNTPKCVVGGSQGETASMLQVLKTTKTGDINELGRHAVAALLNAAMVDSTYPLSQGDIVKIFNEVNRTGTYHVDGVDMNLSLTGVIDYFKKLNALLPSG